MSENIVTLEEEEEEPSEEEEDNIIESAVSAVDRFKKTNKEVFFRNSREFNRYEIRFYISIYKKYGLYIATNNKLLRIIFLALRIYRKKRPKLDSELHYNLYQNCL